MKIKLLLFLFAGCSMLQLQAQNVPDAWNYVGNMYPHPDSVRISATAFSIGGSGYVGTGLIPQSTNCYKDFYRIKYDPLFQLDVWSRIADFPLPTYGAVAFGIGGKGYVLTGHRSPTNIVTDQKLYTYDTASNTWSAGVQFPGTPRTDMTCFVVNNKAYVCTGAGAAKEVWQYDPVTSAWSRKNDFPGMPRWYACSFAIGNKGYIGTGVDTAGNALSDFWEYDPATDTWVQKASLPGPGRFWASGVSAGNKGYITSGSAGVVPSDTWEYNPATNTWIMKQQCPGGRTNAVSFSSAGRAYVGTGLGDGRNTIWAFTPGNFSIGSLSNYEYCLGDSIDIPYVSDGLTFQSGNTFIAELDHGVLSFTNPVVLGTLTGTAANGVIRGYIPATATTGISNSRIRIRSTNPSNISGLNPLNLSINARPPQPAITRSGNVLTSSATQGNQWYNASGAITGATGQTYTVTAPGIYYVKVTLNGCSSVASANMNVTPSAVNELHTSPIALYPNPVTDILHVKLPDNMRGSAQVRILNAGGQVVFAREYRTVAGAQLDLPVTGLSAGIYVFEFIAEQANMHRSFIIR